MINSNNKNVDIDSLKASEKALINRVVNRDQQAFRQLYEEYVKRIYGICLRITGNIALAEEASQEVFIQVWRKIDSFTGNSTFSTWLYRVASNTAISYMRKQKSWLTLIVSKKDKDEPVQEEHYAPNPDLSSLDQLILKLPERARVVFVLHAIEGFSHEDIAKKLRTSTNTSKAHFHRAKNLITAWLEEES